MQENTEKNCEALVRVWKLRQPLHEGVSPSVLRLGLVLNGTVSAGAWTAGALDALIEALDAFYAAKAAGNPAAAHDVQVEIVGGASGGGVCAALLAKAIHYRFPPARCVNSNAGNPFWQIWVEQLDVAGMLRRRQPWQGPAELNSLLSANAIESAARSILRWEGERLSDPRPWVAQGFRVLLTQTNLRGVPYTLPLQAPPGARARATSYVAHADHVVFAATDGAGNAALREDEFPLSPPGRRDTEGEWLRLADHARASGAFPVGFPPVRLSRPARHYEWRAVVLPAGGGKRARVVLLNPRWPPGFAEEDYEYFAVDGGALNNSPFQLVHDRMTGLRGSFQRGSTNVDGCILILDPLAAFAEDSAPPGHLSMFGAFRGLAKALVAHGRYSTSELLLASADDVESRHLVTAARRPSAPSRAMRARASGDGDRLWGADALCTSGFGAFLGFLDRRYRAHDFHLGRRNMLGWLDRHFKLSGQHPIFRGTSTSPADRSVIPLLDISEPPQPAWPERRADYLYLARLAAARLRDVTAAHGRIAGLLRWPVDWFARPELRKTVSQALDHLDARR